MPKYVSTWKVGNHETDQESINQRVVDHISDVYELGDSLGMTAEYTRADVEVGPFVKNVEYFGAQALDYEQEDVGRIREAEMEVDLPGNGYIGLEYDGAPYNTVRMEAEIPKEEVKGLEDELEVAFQRSLSDACRSATSQTAKKLGLN